MPEVYGYTGGSITVTSGSTAVTGTTTAWLDLLPGDEVLVAGVRGVVNAVNSNTSITLLKTWSGSTYTGTDYIILYRSDLRHDVSRLAEYYARWRREATTFIPTTGQPSDLVGSDGWVAWDAAANIFYKKDAGAWDAGTSTIGSGPAPTMQVFTSSGTWTKPTGCDKVKVTVVGGGGGGGGVAGSSSSIAIGASGGGAGAAVKYIDVSAISSVAVTVGAGGAGGADTGAGGATGGNTLFGSHCYATGGFGGSYATPAATVGIVSGASGGMGVNGDVNVQGGASGVSVRLSGVFGYSSEGGVSVLGGGGGARRQGEAGIAGGGYGSGGSGAVSNNATGRAGGSGASGICIVEEYY